ncbi:MAG: radical SAM protein, partial [Marinilabiliales bacterium]
WDFNNTKPFYGKISPGCKLCGEGDWSCLFLTGKCNTNCFYCPSEQTEAGIPQTQGMEFASVNDYNGYLKWAEFKGISIT